MNWRPVWFEKVTIELLDVQDANTEISNSVDGGKSRQDRIEERIGELEDYSFQKPGHRDTERKHERVKIPKKEVEELQKDRAQQHMKH